MRTTVGIDDARASGLEDLYVRHAPEALRLAYVLCGDAEAARDLVHDAFVRVAGRFRHLRQPDDFAAYLRRTIVNLHISRLRRLKVERTWLTREARLPAQTSDGWTFETRDHMWHAILGLPPRQRAAVVLRFYEDLSERQTADLLRCSVGAVNQLVARAMVTLRARIGDDAR